MLIKSFYYIMQPHKQTSQIQSNRPYCNQKLCKMFQQVTEAPFDVIHQTAIQFTNDKSLQKINLCQGVYKDQNGESYIFQVVRKAEQQLSKNINMVKAEYLNDGFQNYCKGAQKIIFGKDCLALEQQRVATMQTLSGTGALYFGFHFISQYLSEVPRTIYISDPTWPTHPSVIEVNRLKVGRYPYYDHQIKGLNFQKMINFFKTIQIGAVVLLQTAGHNPTGCDLSEELWKQICQVMKQRQLIPFFDPAYQGFATGDMQKDIWPVRYFLQQGFFMLVAQSFSKNMGLYGERIGAIHIVTSDKASAWNVYTKIRSLARKIYLSPPAHGAYLVDKIINNQDFYSAWTTQLRDKVASRIVQARKLLRQELQRISTPGQWHHITQQTGMFSFTGLTIRQCQILTQKYHIYLLKNGRIAITGINLHNYQRVARCIKISIEESNSGI